MAKSLSSIMTQIERLQKEAASLQSEAVMRIRKEIAKYGLTPEQLFGGAAPRKTTRATRAKAAAAPKAAKYADGAGGTWGGRGKRPEWLRQALAAGRALEEFLVQKAAEPAAKRAPRKKAGAAAKPKAAPKKRAARKTVARKARAKAAPAAAA